MPFAFNTSLFHNEYVFSICTKILSVGIGLFYSVLFARFVGPELKGSLAYIASIVSTGSIILSLGIHHAYPYFRKNAEDKLLYRRKFVSTSIVFFCFYFCVLIIPVACFAKDQIIVASSALMVLWSYNRVEGYVVLIETPNKRNRALLFFTIIEVLFVLILFLTVKANFLLGLLCMSCLEICKFFYFTVRNLPFFSYSMFDCRHAWEIACFGFLPMLALLMTTLNYRIDVIMLKNASNILLSEVGIYSIGIALTEKVLLIPDSIQEILLSKLAKQKGPDEVASVSRMTLPVCMLVALAIIAVGKPFLDFFYGEEYNGAYLVTCICLIGTPWMIFFKMISQYNIVHRRQARNIVLLLVAVITNIILNSIFVPFFKINGAALATAISNLFCAILFVVDFSRETKIGFRSIVFLKKNDLLLLRSMTSSRK